MADVSKIKLPDNNEYNIKDARIAGVDASPTSGSDNVVKSGGVYSALGDYVPKSGCTMDEEAELTIPAYEDSDLSTECSITTSAVEINDYISGYDIVLDGEYPALTVKSNVGNANQQTTHYAAENIVHSPTSDNTSYQYDFPAKSGTFAMTSDIPEGLPSVTSSDNNKVLQVTNGAWAAGTLSGYLPLSGGSMTGNLSIVKSSDASITITTDSSGSPALILIRGDQTDAYSDWKIINDGGVLCFKSTQSSTESEYVRVGAGVVSVLTGTSGSPEIRLTRGTTADSYVDWRIVNNGGSIEFQRSVSNASTTMTRINTTGLIPYGTVTNNVSSLSLGSQDNKWANIYSNNANFSGDVAVTGNVSAANIPTYHTGTSDPSSTLGSDGDIYLKLSS